MQNKPELWEQLAAVLAPTAYQGLTDEEIALAGEVWMKLRESFGMGHDDKAQEAFLSGFNSVKESNPLELVGAIEWYLYGDEKRNNFGGPLNGQRGRQAIFRELVRLVKISAIVETGSFRGDTTEFMAENANVPVYTTESHPRYFAFARNRLRGVEGVIAFREDARSFLGRLAMDPFFPKERVFFYLDAHWEQDLPLQDEVTIISCNWSDFIIMIDDFRVPDDQGYAYDDYGNGNALCLEYLALQDLPSMDIYWPSLPSSEETGKRRGCVVLTSEGLLRDAEPEMETLRAD